jgi:hypothetical protein
MKIAVLEQARADFNRAHVPVMYPVALKAVAVRAVNVVRVVQ